VLCTLFVRTHFPSPINICRLRRKFRARTTDLDLYTLSTVAVLSPKRAMPSQTSFEHPNTKFNKNPFGVFSICYMRTDRLANFCICSFQEPKNIQKIIIIIIIIIIMYSYCCLCILIVTYVLFCIFCFHRANWHSSATLTEVFPCFFLSCKTNVKV
jgi:hypothetical protein